MRPVPVFKWTALNDGEFEQLIYEVVRAAGPETLELRQGPGDSGWDVEARFAVPDPFGRTASQRWLFEAKHYAGGVPYTALEAARGAADAEEPEKLVIAVSSHLTPSCKNQLAKWRAKLRHTQVETWERQDLERMVLQSPIVTRWALQHGLLRATSEDHLPEEPERERVLSDHDFGVPVRYRISGQDAENLRHCASFIDACLDWFVSMDNECTNTDLHLGLINWQEHLKALALLAELEVAIRAYESAILSRASEADLDAAERELLKRRDDLTAFGKSASLAD